MASSALPTVLVANGTAVVCGLSLVLALSFVSGKLVSNICVFTRLSPDDYASIVGILLFIAYVGVCIGSTFESLVRHESTDRLVDYFAHHTSALANTDIIGATYLKLVYNAELLYALTSAAAKLSVLLLYVRIFSPSKGLLTAIYATAAMVALLSVTSVVIFSVYCAPRTESLIADLPTLVSVCTNASQYALAQQAMDLALNLLILVLPVARILGLNLSLKRRLGVIFILMHGVFALIASAAGIYFRLGELRTGSGLWWQTASYECNVIELGMTLVSSSLHACWGYLRHIHARKTAKFMASRGSTSRYTSHKESRQSSNALELGHTQATASHSALDGASAARSSIEMGQIDVKTQVWVDASAVESAEREPDRVSVMIL